LPSSVFGPVPERVASIGFDMSKYMLKRWDRFARFIEDGRVCFANNAAERALRGFALGRRSWLFAGSERGADRAAAMTTLPSSTTLIRRHGWPMCSAKSLTSPRAGLPNYCRGIGSNRICTRPPDRPDPPPRYPVWLTPGIDASVLLGTWGYCLSMDGRPY
jgi:hypothetical protein